MWRIAEWQSKHRLWFSDGEPVEALRPIDNFETRAGLSSRLIVDKLGFLDITEIPSTSTIALDANGALLESVEMQHPLELSIQINHDSTVTISIIYPEEQCTDEDIEYLYIHPRSPGTTIPLKPLPNLLPSDIKFIKSMIRRSYIPYQNVPAPGGKDTDTITRLGNRFFPFTKHSFELAICVYDWTTASFVRNVFLKIFEYTGVDNASGTPPSPLYPLDLQSIARQIYASNWETYTPGDKAYMNSFMMAPAGSLDEVKTQLAKVAGQLHRLSDVENRIMGLAVQALPRMSVFQRPVVYSGQLDMRQLSLDHFGIEFKECAVNRGPVGEPLRVDLDVFLTEYMTRGQVLTTKAFLSFTDSRDVAMGYSNGLLLVVNPPKGSCVWEQMSLVTPLAVDEKLVEYTFLPGTRFEVEGVERTVGAEKEIIVIELNLVLTGS